MEEVVGSIPTRSTNSLNNLPEGLPCPATSATGNRRADSSARHQKFHFLLNLRDDDRRETSFAQFLVKLGQPRLLESGPFGDPRFHTFARLLVKGDRLRRHHTIPAFDHSQCRGQPHKRTLQPAIPRRGSLVVRKNFSGLRLSLCQS